MTNYETNILVCVTILTLIAAGFVYLGMLIAAFVVLLCAFAVLWLEIVKNKIG